MIRLFFLRNSEIFRDDRKINAKRLFEVGVGHLISKSDDRGVVDLGCAEANEGRVESERRGRFDE